MPDTSNANDSPPVPSIPLVDENSPGLGRHSGWLQQQRKDSGDLNDDVDNPVKDDNPIKVTRR